MVEQYVQLSCVRLGGEVAIYERHTVIYLFGLCCSFRLVCETLMKQPALREKRMHACVSNGQPCAEALCLSLRSIVQTEYGTRISLGALTPRMFTTRAPAACGPIILQSPFLTLSSLLFSLPRAPPPAEPSGPHPIPDRSLRTTSRNPTRSRRAP